MLYNENLYYLLCFCIDIIFGKIFVPELWAKMFSANQIAGFFTQQNLQKKSVKYRDSCILIQIHINWKLMKKYLGGHGQKWVWPVWSGDSKTDCTSRMNGWNEVIFWLLMQIQESLKLFHWFLSECGQKWAWPL